MREALEIFVNVDGTVERGGVGWNPTSSLERSSSGCGFD